MLDLAAILDHFDNLIGRVRDVEGVFKSVSEAETFLVRLRAVREMLKNKQTDQPRYTDLTSAACPGLKVDSMRVSFARFQRQIEQIATKSGHQFKLVKPSRRGRSLDEIQCHFKGIPLPLASEGGDADVALSREHEVIPPRARATRVFVSFAISDMVLAQEFVEMMKVNLPLRCAEPVLLWRFDDKGGVLPGEENEIEIRQRMAESQFGILLISPTYLTRPFIQDVEMPHFLGSHARARAIPVALQDFIPGKDKNSSLDAVNVFQHQGKTFARTARGNRGDFIKALCDRIAELVAKNVPPSWPEVSEHSSLAPDADCEYADLKGRMEATLAKAALPSSDDPSVLVLETLCEWAKNKNDAAYMALLGEAGAGKTMTCSKLDRLLNAERPGSSIYLDLRHLNESGLLKTNRNPTLEEILAATLTRSAQTKLTPKRILDALQTNGALLIWDGLDEVLVHLSTQEGEAFFGQLKEALPPRLLHAPGGKPGRLLLACRTQYFRSFEHESSALTRTQRGAVNASATAEMRVRFRVLRLLPFDDDQIRSYLAVNVPGLDVTRALEVIKQVHNLRDLAQSPYCLSIMRASLGSLDQLLAKGEKIHSVDLYQSLVRSWLARDDTKHRFDQEDKPRLMARLAAWMWREGTKSVTVEKLGQWLKETIFADDTLRDLYWDALKQPASRDELLQDFRTATFIARWDGDAFRFAHTSLQEYFLACHLVANLAGGNAIEAWDMPRTSFETLDFVGQLLAQEPDVSRARCLGNLGQIMGADRPLAASLAFTYWMRAVKYEYPEPNPERVNLAGAEMEGWEIYGHGPGRRLSLRGANLRGIKLNRSSLRYVDMSDADLAGMEARQSLFDDVIADRACMDQADLSSLRWRGGSFRHGRAVTTQATYDWIGVDITNALLSEGWGSLDGTCGGTYSENTIAPQADARAVAFLASVGHSCGIAACKWGPDGKKLLSGSMDGTMKVWDATLGRCLFTLEGHSTGVDTCTWSPDGQKLLSGSMDGTLKVWDGVRGHCLLTLEGHSSGVDTCAWSSNGQKLLSGSVDRSLKVWDAVQGRCLLTLEGHSSGVVACAWSSDSQKLLSGSLDHTLKVWDAVHGRCLLTLEGHSTGVVACEWSPDGQKLLSGSMDGTLKVWDATQGRCLRTLEGHSGGVVACAWSPDGQKLLSGSLDRKLKVWDSMNGGCLLTLEGHSGRVDSCAWSPDGQKMLSSSVDRTLKVWDAALGGCLLTLEGHSGRDTCAWNSDGQKLLAGSMDGTLKVWDAAQGRCLLNLEGHSGGVVACAWSPDGRKLLSGSLDRTLKVWDSMDGGCLLTLEGHSGGVVACAWSPDCQKMLSGSVDRTLKVWDAVLGRCVLTLEGHSNGVVACAWSPGGQKLFSGSVDRTLKVWDALTGVCQWTGYAQPNLQTTSLDAHGRLIACSLDAWPDLE